MLIFISTIYSIASNAASTVLLTSKVTQVAISSSVDILEDVEGLLTILDVTSKAYKNEFIPSSQPRLGFGFTDSTYWIRFNVVDNSVNKKWFLEISYPPLDSLELYSPDQKGGFAVSQSGDLLPFSTRAIKTNNFLFPLSTDKTEQEFYLRVKTQSSFVLPLSIISGRTLTEKVGFNNFFQGAYAGIMVVMAIYNLFIFISVRDRSYLFYVMFILSMGLYQMNISGYSSQFLWPEWVWWGNVSTIFLINISLVFAALFSQSFLHTKKYSKNTHVALNILIISSFSLALTSFFLPYKITVFASAPANFIGLNVLIYAGVVALLNGSRPARYYLIGWSFFLVPAILYSLKILSVLPPLAIFEYGLQIGNCFEVVLLALGLADRINKLKSQALAASENSNRIKDEFMSTITHELLTPMNGLKLSLSLLEIKVRSREGKEILKTANDSGLHLLNIIQSMFIFVQARQGLLRLKYAPINLKETLEGILEQFTTRESKDGLHLSLRLAENLPKWIMGDKNKLTIVIVQLMKNAYSFTNDGEVTLMCEALEKEKMIRFSVKDTGTGISQERQAEIFEGFRQLDSSSKRTHSGMGIGLTIVSDLLSLMNTTLKLDSELGRGTTFSFEIQSMPVAEELIELPGEIAHVDESKYENAKILVVEDNPVNMILLCKVLEKFHFTPLRAFHGKQALFLLQKNPDIAAILMDCQMPVMDGYEATREIRKKSQFKNIPIIAVTANVSELDQQRCIEAGMSDYLAKPVDKNTIHSTLIKWLEAG